MLHKNVNNNVLQIHTASMTVSVRVSGNTVFLVMTKYGPFLT